MPERRLIDLERLALAASRAGAAERHGHGETAHTTQIWWARRPHSAMRALCFAALCPAGAEQEEALALLDALAATPLAEDALLARAERLLLRAGGERPRLLDMFGGGGTIGLEAANLGADVTSVDLNELSVFLQRCHLESAPAARVEALRGLVALHGARVLERLRRRTDPLFPLRPAAGEPAAGAPVAYLWSYTFACPACGYRFSLSRRPWLARRPGRLIRVAYRDEEGGQTPEIVTAASDPARAPRRRDLGCPRCGARHAPPAVQRCQDTLVALVARGSGVGKAYGPADPRALPDTAVITAFEAEIIQQLGCALPASRLPRWSGVINPPLVGLESHADLFLPRQRALLLALIVELRAELDTLRAVLSAQELRFVMGALSGLIDQLVDWNGRLSMWIPQNEQVGRALCGPGLAMLWDFAETDPLLDGPANLHAKLDRVVSGLAALGCRRGPARVLLADARRLPLPDASFDAIVTDPPYYDNLYYSALADCLFAWKRLLLGALEPALFAPELTSGGGGPELVASAERAGSAAAADDAYTHDLGVVLREAARLLKPDGVLCWVFGHGVLGAWRCLVRAFRASGLHVDSAQPLCVERRARPRAVASVAVNTCVVFVARPRSAPLGTLGREEFQSGLQAALESGLAQGLRAAGWREEDVGMALFAHGVQELANLAEITGLQDDEALRLVAAEVQVRCPAFTLRERRSL